MTKNALLAALAALSLTPLSLGAAAAPTLDVKGFCFTEQIASTYLNVFGEIENTQGVPVQASGKLVVYDRAGRVVLERTGLGTSTLNPGEKLPVYTTATLNGPMDRCALRYSFRPADAAPRAAARDLAGRFSESVGIRSVRVTATVHNPNAFALRSGIVNVTGYDARGRVVMVGSHSFFTRLDPGASTEIAFTAQHVAAKPVRYAAVVEAVQAR